LPKNKNKDTTPGKHRVEKDTKSKTIKNRKISFGTINKITISDKSNETTKDNKVKVK
jgi:hypothetical protein